MVGHSFNLKTWFFDMAQYIGFLQGGKGEASRLGHKTSGLTATVNGWNSGVKVYAFYCDERKRDVIRVEATTGSKQTGRKVIIGEVMEQDGQVIFILDNKIGERKEQVVKERKSPLTDYSLNGLN